LISTLKENPENLVRFRAAPWQFQRTFKTPKEQLPVFLRLLLEQFEVESGVITTDLIVFEPSNVLELLLQMSVEVDDKWAFVLAVEGKADLCTLLEAVLEDWIDFLFVPKPEEVAIYADHDEFLTVFTAAPDSLQILNAKLEREGYETATGYTRQLTADGWINVWDESS
jgi:hypothetical protein